MATSASRGSMPAVETLGTPTLWIMAGLALGIVGGILGSFFDSGDDMQSILYSLSHLGGLMAGMLLLVRHARAGLDLSAAGFGAFAAISIVGVAAGFTGPGAESVEGFLAVMLWGATWLIAAQNWSYVWGRGAAALSGLFFALWGYGYALGDEPVDVDSPMVIIAWVAFTVAAVGWLMTLREEDAGATTSTTTTLP